MVCVTGPLLLSSHCLLAVTPIHNIQADQIIIYVTVRFVFNLKLQSELLGPANIRSRIPPPPTPDKFVECMTAVACLKLFHK